MKYLIILLIFLFPNYPNKQNTCYLKGQVIDRNSKTLILKKKTEDLRYSGTEIPIDSSGNFTYNMNFQFIEAYELIFKDELNNGAWRPIMFFPDGDTIKFTLYPMQEAEKNRIVGSKLSLEENMYNETIKKKFYDKYVYWNQKLDSLRNIDETDSDYYAQASDSVKSIMEAVPLFELQYLKNKTNLYGYSKLLETLKIEKDRRLLAIDTLKEYSNLFQQKFPNHPYNRISQFRLDALTNIKVGGYYVNFTAKDSAGKNITLSNIIISNRLTLIDLWAPWCGPCIKKSKKVIPIYEEFKNSGFDVISVIGGINTQEKFLQAIKKHKYPWMQLAEISNENNVWEKYNISNSGGSQFLVNSKGIIQAINPEPEELKKLLQGK